MMGTSMQTTVQIGGLLADDSTTDYVPGLEPCGGEEEPEPTSFDPIAGWTPVSDVVEHNKLDLDTLAMETNADLQTEEGFSAAYEAYSVGGNRYTRDMRDVHVDSPVGYLRR